MFAGENKCEDCVMFHNNWIRTFNAKKYRFKEHLLWTVDHDGYYSDTNAKYITYGNNVYLGQDKTHLMEHRALHNAFVIGHILNRIVILPKFYCYKCHYGCKRPACAAHVHFNIKSLDQFLGNQYREHVFLHNHLVPDSINNFISDYIYLTPGNGTEPPTWQFPATGTWPYVQSRRIQEPDASIC